MDSFPVNPVGLGAVVLALSVLAAVGAMFRRLSGRKSDLRRMITLLRASDPVTRVQALDRSQLLPPARRDALGKALRSELTSAARGGKHPPQQSVTVWFIRQVLALLGDSRSQVRSDAARVLGAVMGGQVSPLAGAKGDHVALAPAVAAAVELAGGRVLAANEQARSETRVLALAEMLEAGLRPLAVGLKALEGVEEEALEPVGSALRDRSPRVRRSLVEVLAAMGGERAVQMLLPLLRDPSPELRAHAARALADLKAEAAAPDLVHLLDDPMGEVRAAAASALAQTEQRSACASVLDALERESRRDDPAEPACAAMIEAVVRLCDYALADLARVLGSLPRPVARRLATALESSGVIERWLSTDAWRQSEQLLGSLLGAVAELGITAPLLNALDSTQEWARVHAAAALGHSRQPGALTAIAALLTDPDEEVRRAAVRSVARHGEAPALEPLARAVADPDHAVRLAAVSGLRAVLSQRPNWRPEALPPDFDLPAAMLGSERALLHAAGDSQSEVRAGAAKALGLLSSAEAASALSDLAVEDGDEGVRQVAGEALAACGFAQKRRLLAGFLESADETRRARALAALGMLGGTDVSRQLVDALDDRSEQVRSAALTGLSRVDVSGLGEALAAHLRNPDPRVRAAVATQLRRAPGHGVTEMLVEALSDPDEDVRVSALGALSGMGRAARRHQTALMARRSDPSPRVRDAAAAALSELRASWTEVAQASELLRQGPLSPSGAAALVDMAAAGDVEPLLRAFGNQQAERAIAAVLVESAGERLPGVLTAFRKAPEQDQMRAAAALARALQQGGSARSFLDQLRALDSDVRLMAVEIAGRLGTPEAVDALIEVLAHDPVAEVRSRGASALADAPGEPAALALRRALEQDPHNVVRRVAARALDRDREQQEERSIFSQTDGQLSSQGGTSEVA